MNSIRFCQALVLSLSWITTAYGELRPPNVVLIFADDLGYGDLGCYGATKLKTPHIDKLAAEGRKFTDAHSSSAVCTPSRYGLLTGAYPYKANGGKGLWGPAPITSPLLIDPDTQTIADLFKKSGYDTAVFGKWHLGFGTGKNTWKEPLRPGPQDLGFDYYFGMPVVNSAPPYVYVENDRVVGSDPDDPLVHVGRGGKGVTPITPISPEAAQRSPNQFRGAVEAHKLFNDFEVGTKLTEKATQWIGSRKDKPFFLYFATTNVHHPFTPAKQFQGTSKCGVYGDFVHELDWIVGEVMKSLEVAGVADNTLVIFTSDNGGMFNLGGRVAAAKGHKINGELLGSKFGIWEGGHRVPFIAWWPGKIEAGTVSDQMTISVDLLATFAALTGQKLSAAERKDSINILPALTGDSDKPLRTEMFVTPNKPTHMAFRKGKWMYIPAKSDGGFRGSKPGQHAWGGAAVTKLVGTPNSDIENGVLKKDAPPAQLYDLVSDVNQTKNLYHDHPDVVREMAAALKKARQDANPVSNSGTKSTPPEPQGPPLSKYDQFEPAGNLRYSFESGELEGWTVNGGDFGQAVTSLPSLAKWKHAPFARHGGFHLSTLVEDDGESLSDRQTGILRSPAFKLIGGRVSFLVSGGYHEDDLFIALVDAGSGKVLIKTGGARDHRMRRIVWDVSNWTGRVVRFEVVDRSEGGWGHLNVDDFSAPGKPVAVPAAPAPKVKGKTEGDADSVQSSGVAKKPLRQAQDRPNFVVFLADDMGWGDSATYGHPLIKTPNLDKLASQGVKFTQCYSACGVCSPSRSAILTGRTPYRNGVWRHLSGNHKAHLRASESTYPKLLKGIGYETCHVGKWHLNSKPQFNNPEFPQPGDHGYDYFLYTHNNASPSHKNPDNFFLNGKPVGETKGYSAQLVASEAARWLKGIRDPEKPFALSVWVHEPHSPISTDPKFAALYDGHENAKYMGNITQLDHALGQVMDALDGAGVADNTLVIFSSDNGPVARFGGATGGLRGGKRSSHEGGIRVPGVARWPGRIESGTTSDVPVIGTDIFATVLDIVGIPLPDDRTIDGVSMLPAFEGKSLKRPVPLFWRTHVSQANDRVALRIGDWKIVGNDTLTKFQLFEIQKDWKEENDLAATMPEKTEEMKRVLLKVWKDIESEGPSEWWKSERQKPSKGAKLNY